MSERMFLGNLGGRQLLRITPPGYDASNLSHPAVVSSDNDYLKIHISSPSSGVDFPVVITGGNGAFFYYGYYVPFADLGYIPMAWVGLCMSEVNNRIFYPYDNPLTDRFPEFSYMVGRTGIWFYARGLYFRQDFKLRYIVFKNAIK